MRNFYLILITTSSIFALPALAQLSSSGEQPTRFRITNQRDKPIWIQQDFKYHTPNDPIVIKIEPQGHYDYKIPPAGLASTRFWAKTGCNPSGFDCAVGESVGIPFHDFTTADQQKFFPLGINQPQPANGFMPDINSKLEVTWGCEIYDEQRNPQDRINCAINPSSSAPPPLNHINDETYWNASGVDGYTLPFKILVKGNHECKNAITGKTINNPDVDCSHLDPNACPIEDLSSNNFYKSAGGIDLTKIDLKYTKNGTPTGCFSPCAKLTLAQDQGLRHKLGAEVTPESEMAKMYCCSGVSNTECIAQHTKSYNNPNPLSANYMESIHKKQNCPIYTYAYDDALGLAKCNAEAKYELIFTEIQAPGATPASTEPSSTAPTNTAPDTTITKQHTYNLGLPATLLHGELIINGKPVDWQGGMRTINIVGDSFTAKGPNGSDCTINIVDDGRIHSTYTGPSAQPVGNCPAIVSPDGKTMYFPANF